MMFAAIEYFVCVNILILFLLIIKCILLLMHPIFDIRSLNLITSSNELNIPNYSHFNLGFEIGTQNNIS